MKSAIAGGIMFFLWTVSAYALDPACGKSGMVLQSLDQCTRLYCARQIKEESTREAIKAADDSLADLQKQMIRLTSLVTKFQAVCQRLRKKFCEDPCPDFIEFSDTHGLVEMTFNASERVEKKIEELGPALSKVNTVEGDLSCHKQVKEQLDKALSLRRNLLIQFNGTKCQP